MRKIPLIAAAVVLGLAGAGAYAWRAQAQEVGVSKVRGNPGAYVGKVKITGKTGGVDPTRGLLQIVDEKACCDLVLAVPVTAEQRAQLGTDTLYSGALPQPGQPIEAHGVIRAEQGGHRLDVSKITSSGKVVLRRM